MSFNPDVLPKAFRAEYDRLSPAAKRNWQAERLKAQTDQLFLSEVLGFDFQEIPHRSLFNQFFKKDPDKNLYDISLDIKKVMVLWSRGVYKTSAVIVEIIQLILCYPNIRILFLTGSDELAKRQLARIKRFFEQPTKRFKQLFPDFCGEKLGTTQWFTVPAQTAMTFAEPTMAISTARSVKSGAHYDVIFIDDLVNDQNYRSPMALNKCYQQYLDTCPLLAPSGFMYVTGTRYSFADTYERIQENARKEMAELGQTIWKFSIRSCWVQMCKCGHSDAQHNLDRARAPCLANCDCSGFAGTGERHVLFPQYRTRDGRTEGHTVDFLRGEKLRLGDEFFSCQYENNPLSSGTQTFSPELIDQQTIFQLKDLPPLGTCPTFFVGDLSYVGDDHRDLSVLLVCQIKDGQIFVRDCISGKWSSMETAQNLVIGMMKYRPRIIWLEKFLGWEAYQTVFTSFCNDKGIQKLPLEWFKMANQEGAKKIRIGSIQGWLRQKRLWLFAGMPQFEILCDQLKKWPKLGRHDDFADTLGLACSVPSGACFTAVPKVETQVDWLKKIMTPKVEEEAQDNRPCGSY